MNNKNFYIFKIIRNIIIECIFIYLFFRIVGIAKICMIPFIICGISIIGKDICFVLNKKKGANIFNKSFIVSFLSFWFGVIIFGSYLFIKQGNYASLIFTIPFWYAGIYIIRKYLIPKKNLRRKYEK